MARLSRRPASGYTILVVDDEEETLESLRALLERHGHRVLVAQTGEEALTTLRREDVQLLLVDYYMPRMNGAELVQRIRAFDQYVQIILQTGYAGEQPPLTLLEALDIQGYHDKADGPDKLLVWLAAGFKAHRLVERLKERERLQSDLVANVSHELRTPLNIITGYAEMLLDGQFGALEPEASDPVQNILLATRNLTGLVSDFLQYAKIEAGVTNVSGQVLTTAELAQELQRLGHLLLEHKHVSFGVLTEGAPTDFVSDAVKLRTILRDLVTNAAKFTSAGAVTVRIQRHGTRLEFAVEDSGPGIRPEDQEVIFEPFRQADGSSTRQHGGIGLGLAISRKFAHLLGGDLSVKSTLEVGSTFVLSIPCTPAAHAPGVAAA